MNLTCWIGKHEWTGCRCSACRKTRDEGHDWTEDCEKCSRCGASRSAAHNWTGCKCSACGKTRDGGHDWSKDCEKCSRCGVPRSAAHRWTGCRCSACGKTRDEGHDWSKDCEKCSRCGASRSAAHRWTGCRCSACGKTRDEGHDWSKDCEKCSRCGASRSAAHRWTGCRCSACSKTRDEGHDWSKDCEKCSCCGASRSEAHKWTGRKCSTCGMALMTHEQIENLISDRDFQAALDGVSDLLTYSSQDVEARFLHATALTMMDRDEEALKSVSQLLETAPNMVKALRLAAMICIKSGRGPEATHHMEAAVAATDGEVPPALLITLGDSYARSGQLEKAIHIYRSLYTIASPFERGCAKMNAAIALMNLGDFGQAARLLSEGMRDVPEHPAGELLPEARYLDLLMRLIDGGAAAEVNLIDQLKIAAAAASERCVDAQAIARWLEELKISEVTYDLSEAEKTFLSAAADVARTRRTESSEERGRLLKSAQAKAKVARASGNSGAVILHIRLSHTLRNG